jgi:ribonuclease G
VAGRISRRARKLIYHYDGSAAIFDHYGIDKQIEEAFRRKVHLKSGAYLVFDETEALIAIDVNTGRYRGKAGGSQEDAILEVNLEAVAEVSRQVRLRNTGGLLVLDLMDMKSRKHQNVVYKAMKTAMRRDRARTNVLPISDLGLMEMTRQRQDESILSQAYTDCPYCKGHGVIKSPLAISVDLQRQVAAVMRQNKQDKNEGDLLAIVAPLVLDRLRSEDEEILVALQDQYAGKLSFKTDPYRHPEAFDIFFSANGKLLYSTNPQAMAKADEKG